MKFSPRLAAAVAVACLALALVPLVMALDDPGPGPPSLRAGELSADAFLDSVGVVTHLHYADTAYGRRAEVIAALKELGVRHIRDAMPLRSGPLADGLRAVREAGIEATLGTGIDRDPAVAVADSLAVMGGGVAAFEGPNEIDAGGDPAWPVRLDRFMPALARAVRAQAPGVPVIGPSFIDPANRARVPADLPGLFNAHPYSGALPPEPSLHQALLERRAAASGRGAVFTETGYHNALAANSGQPPASEQAAAVYIPRSLMTAFGSGVRRTFIYELLDEKPDPALAQPEWHFGLLRSDLSPKPAFTALRTLLAALRDTPGAPSVAWAGWDFAREPGDRVQRLTLVRRDGSRVIALWRPVAVWDREARRAVDPGKLDVELRFAGLGGREVAVWRPSVSSAPVLRRERVRRLRLRLRGDLVLVSAR